MINDWLIIVCFVCSFNWSCVSECKESFDCSFACVYWMSEKVCLLVSFVARFGLVACLLVVCIGWWSCVLVSKDEKRMNKLRCAFVCSCTWSVVLYGVVVNDICWFGVLLTCVPVNVRSLAPRKPKTIIKIN